jgi:hypothetical protein
MIQGTARRCQNIVLVRSTAGLLVRSVKVSVSVLPMVPARW